MHIWHSYQLRKAAAEQKRAAPVTPLDRRRLLRVVTISESETTIVGDVNHGPPLHLVYFAKVHDDATSALGLTGKLPDRVGFIPKQHGPRVLTAPRALRACRVRCQLTSQGVSDPVTACSNQPTTNKENLYTPYINMYTYM